MSENQAKDGTGLLEAALDSGVKKAGESAVDRVLNAVMDGIKSVYGGTRVVLGTAFRRYLDNATQRYNLVRTLATGQTPRTIVGNGNIYVSVGVQYGDKEIDTETVEPLLSISKNILIQGTGGIGKSMLMRYLFLDTAYGGEYIPVLLELRRISNQKSGQISILDLVYSSIQDFDVQLPREQFEYSLRLGKYLFLMDGFDEVKESMAAETADAIQTFCSKYPKNPCIITSRPRRDTSSLETFTEVRSNTLSLDQAVELASKIWEEDEKTREFCRQLKEGLYKKHKDFAENPLLLSMMFLTFMKNNSVPEHLVEFYRKAYDAIYSAHDSTDKGIFRREFRCATLDESGFRLLLSHFCFQTYFKEIYEFPKELVISLLEKSVKKLGLQYVKPVDYLQDICDVVCILVEEGDVYRFSHRSFQTYFAACYTSNVLTDEQQKKLFSKLLSESEIFWDREDYYELLVQTEPHRFAVNALEEQLRLIRKSIDEDTNPDEYFIKLQYNSISITQRAAEQETLSYEIGSNKYGNRNYNIIAAFRRYVSKINYRRDNGEDLKIIGSCFKKITCQEDRYIERDFAFEEIDSSSMLSGEERLSLYSAVARIAKTNEQRVAIAGWLDELDAKRASLATDDFIDDL